MSNEEQKIAELENDPVSKLLGGLKRVEAPGDFDFRVKARIASGSPAESNKSWLPASVRLAVPLGLLLMIGGYFGYNGLYPTNNNIAVVPVVEIQEAVPVTDLSSVEPAAAPGNEVVAQSLESKPTIPDNTIITKPTGKRIVLTGSSNRQPGGGFVDRARRISTLLTPKSATASAKDVLTYVGIGVDSSWKVGTVKQNSMADRSGLKTGDVIEAINEQNLTERSTFVNKSSGKTIRVRRDDKSIQIDLKP